MNNELDNLESYCIGDISEKFVKIEHMNIYDTTELSFEDNYVLFVPKGSVAIKYANNHVVNMSENNVLMIPLKQKFKIYSFSTASLLFYKLSLDIFSNMDFGVDKDVIKKMSNDFGISLLKANSVVSHFFKSLIDIQAEDINNQYYYESKTKEFFYILQNSCDKEDLFRLFYFRPSELSNFKIAILDYCDNNIKIKDLAFLLGYSYSGFNKRFKQIFGIAPTRWIRERRAQKILTDIESNYLSLKEIAFKYGFCSQSHLFVFCRNFYGKSPKELRNIVH